MEFRFQDKSITFSDSQLKAAEINKTLECYAQQAFYVLVTGYDFIIDSWEKLLDDNGDMAKKVVDVFIPDIMKMIMSAKIYDYDEEDLKGCCNQVIDTFYANLTEPYMAILEKMENDEAYRYYRKENRGRVIGGGFGLSGAAKGMLEASAINMATGLAHDLINAAGNAFSNMAAHIDLADLFKKGDSRLEFANLSYRAIRATRNLIWEEYVDKGLIEKSAIDRQEKRTSILFDNLKKGRVAEEDRLDVILEVLKNDPYQEEEYYDYLKRLCTEQDMPELQRMKECLYFRAQQIEMSDLNEGAEPTEFDKGINNKLIAAFNFDYIKTLKDSKNPQLIKKEEDTDVVEVVKKAATAIKDVTVAAYEVEKDANKKEQEAEKEEILESSRSEWTTLVVLAIIGAILSAPCGYLIENGAEHIATFIMAIQLLLFPIYAFLCYKQVVKIRKWNKNKNYPQKMKKLLAETDITDPEIIRANMTQGLFTGKAFLLLLISVALTAIEIATTVSVNRGCEGNRSFLTILMFFTSPFLALLPLAAITFGFGQRAFYFKQEEQSQLDLAISEAIEDAEKKKAKKAEESANETKEQE